MLQAILSIHPEPPIYMCVRMHIRALAYAQKHFICRYNCIRAHTRDYFHQISRGEGIIKGIVYKTQVKSREGKKQAKAGERFQKNQKLHMFDDMLFKFNDLSFKISHYLLFKTKHNKLLVFHPNWLTVVQKSKTRCI